MSKKTLGIRIKTAYAEYDTNRCTITTPLLLYVDAHVSAFD